MRPLRRWFGWLTALALGFGSFGPVRAQSPPPPPAAPGGPIPIDIRNHQGYSSTFYGEVVDIAAFLKDGSRGEKFRAHGQRNADRGAVLGLFNPFSNEIVLPLSEHEESPNRMLRPYVGKVIKVTGLMYEHIGGLHAIVVQKLTVPSAEDIMYSQYITDISGVDMSFLTDKQRDLAIKILNTQLCPCGQGDLTIARHIMLSPTCQICVPMARNIIAAIRDRKSEKFIVDHLASYAPAPPSPQGPGPSPGAYAPPPPGQRVDVALDDAATEGPKDAPVTLVEFTDFQ